MVGEKLIWNKKPLKNLRGFICTEGGNRTHTVLLPLDFESSASTNSATSANGTAKLKNNLNPKTKITTIIL